jgi:hypothetical protein
MAVNRGIKQMLGQNDREPRQTRARRNPTTAWTPRSSGSTTPRAN